MNFQSYVSRIGDIVSGRIVAIEQTGVLVDFEMNRPIHIPLLELSINEIQTPEDALQLNEVREFLVIGNYDGTGEIFFSNCSPDTLKDSDRLYAATYHQVSLKYSHDVCELSVILHTKILSVHGGGVSARLQWFLGSQEHPPTVSFSIRQLEIKKAWERVRQLHANEVILSTTVIKKNRASIVKIEGLLGSVRTYVSKHRDELAEGNEVSFRIMTVEEEYNRIVLIPYSVWCRINQLQIGQIVSGQILFVKKYGVYVDIGDIKALLPTSKTIYSSVDCLGGKVFKANYILQARIVSIDVERGLAILEHLFYPHSALK